MRVVTLLLLVGGLAGAYQLWHGHAGNAALKAAASENGFVPVEMPEGTARDKVLILAPPNCPSEQARRAEALAQDLARQGIPVVRGDSISFAMADPTAEQNAGVERAVAVFKQGAPAVFINGMAMSNPSTAQAASEYRRTSLQD